MHQYHDLLNQILDHGIPHSDRTGVGTLSLFGASSHYDLEDGFPLMTTKRLSFKNIAEELFWILSGSTNVEHLRVRGDAAGKPIKIWDEWATMEQCARFSRPAGELGPVYGHQWRNYGATKINLTGDPLEPEEILGMEDHVGNRWINFGYNADGFDQIRKLCDDLANNPRSRRMIVTGWHPVEANEVALPPCHTLFHLKWHEQDNRLDLLLYQRSCDVFLGVPYNIASYALLLKLLAMCFKMEAGTFVHFYGDVHIYSNHMEQVREQLSRTPKKLPTLLVNPRLYGAGFDGLMDAKWSDLVLDGYDPDPNIKADVAV